MTHNNFLRLYKQLQHTITFDELIELEFALIGFNRIDSSTYWNNALIDKLITKSELLKLEKKFESLHRIPTISFENCDKLHDLKEFLTKHNYSFNHEDSWMFHSGDAIDSSKFESVRKVENRDDLKLFLDIFNRCYFKNDSQGPYGELSSMYLEGAKKAWLRHHKIKRLEYFIVFENKMPVAVSSLASYKSIGYISNVGSLKGKRGRGFGKLATLYCVSQSQLYGNSEHCLAAEKGTYPNEFYKRIGFKTRFTSLGYTKN